MAAPVKKTNSKKSKRNVPNGVVHIQSTFNNTIVSISDKIETLISLFISGKRPSGSSDPYALRRNLNGVILIIWHFELEFSIENIFEELLEYWKISLPNFKFVKEKVLNDLIEFTNQRIVSHLDELSTGKELIMIFSIAQEIPNKIYGLIISCKSFFIEMCLLKLNLFKPLSLRFFLVF